MTGILSHTFVLFYYYCIYIYIYVAPSWEWRTCASIVHLSVSRQLLVNTITDVMRTQQLHLCVQVPPPLQAPDVDLLTSGGVVPPPGSMVPDMQTEIVVQSSPPSVAM